MTRLYTASFEGVAVTAIQDVFEINAPADAVVVLHSCTITQESDAGDSEAEMLRITMSRSVTASGSGGTNPGSRPVEVGDSAFGGSVEVNNTTQATGLTLIYSQAFNVQSGFFWEPGPEGRTVISPSGRLVISLPVAPSDSLTMNGSILFEEIGG